MGQSGATRLHLVDLDGAKEGKSVNLSTIETNLLRGFMVEVKVVPPKRNWVQTWWQSLNSLSRLLVIALAAPLVVLNVWALSAIFGYFVHKYIPKNKQGR